MARREPKYLGVRFGELTVVGYVHHRSQYHCTCDCGKQRTVKTSQLSRGKTVDCGHAAEARYQRNQRRREEKSIRGAMRRTRAAITKARREAPFTAIAHCGAWHTIAYVPWDCPLCGWVLDTTP